MKNQTVKQHLGKRQEMEKQNGNDRKRSVDGLRRVGRWAAAFLLAGFLAGASFGTPGMDRVNAAQTIQTQAAVLELDKLILIPRIYTNKPRTTGEGYKGITSQPDPEKKPDFLAGLMAMRKMHIRAIKETGLTAADEMLYPENWGYVSDILSYVAIGARSVEDQQHRLTVSGFDVAAGMKNPTSGDFSVMLNSVYAAQHPHSFIYTGWEVNTHGNDLAHTVLRGATNKHGANIPNYHYEDLIRLWDMYEKMDLKNPACVIDANHSNSNKQFKEQIRITKEVMHSRKLSPDLHKLVKGVMIESYIEEGNQKVGAGCYGKSITDPCLGWEDSERLIYDIAEYE